MSRTKWSPVGANALGFTCTRSITNRKQQRKCDTERRVDAQPKPPPQEVRETTKLYATCARCNGKYEIMPGCPLLNPKVQQERADKYYCDAFILNPDTECKWCCLGWEMSGWCIIEDSVDDDDDPVLIKYKKDELTKYYKDIADGRALRAYLKVV